MMKIVASIALVLLAGAPQEEFGKVLKQLIDAAPDDWKALRGKASILTASPGVPLNWEATVKLPGAESALVWSPTKGIPYTRHSCSFFSGEDAKAMEKYEALVKQVRAGLPEAWTSREEKIPGAVGKTTTIFSRKSDELPSTIEVGVLRLKATSSVTIFVNNRPK